MYPSEDIVISKSHLFSMWPNSNIQFKNDHLLLPHTIRNFKLNIHLANEIMIMNDGENGNLCLYCYSLIVCMYYICVWHWDEVKLQCRDKPNLPETRFLRETFLGLLNSVAGKILAKRERLYSTSLTLANMKDYIPCL